MGTEGREVTVTGAQDSGWLVNLMADFSADCIFRPERAGVEKVSAVAARSATAAVVRSIASEGSENGSRDKPVKFPAG